MSAIAEATKKSEENGLEEASIGSLHIQPLRPTIGGRVRGIDLRMATDAQCKEIDAAMDRFAVLVFPNQSFTDDEQFFFGSRFGTIEDAPSAIEHSKHRLANKQINDISNLGQDGKILAADERRRMYSLGNMLWHSDSSFRSVPAQYSMLHARVIPPEGGETEFADMRAAWDDLPEKMKDKVRDLVGQHSYLYSRAQLGFTDFSPEEIAACKPVDQRLVRRHESTGRLSLFLSAHLGRLHGLQAPEAMMLIRDLTEFATQPKYVYQHVWNVGDLVIWDNRATMHRGKAYESTVYPRELRRVTVKGSRSSMIDQ